MTAVAFRPTFSTVERPDRVWGPNWRCVRTVRHARSNGWLEADPVRGWRLTPAGRLRALRGRDPEPLWDAPWDGQWRLIVFDLPESRRSLRAALRRRLSRSGFGCLQRSVWITPHPFDRTGFDGSASEHQAKEIVRLEARTANGTDPADLVSAAWDWKTIDACHGAMQRAL